MKDKQEEFLERLRAQEEAFAALVAEAENWNAEQVRNLPPVCVGPIDMGRLFRAGEWIEQGMLLAARAIRGR